MVQLEFKAQDNHAASLDRVSDRIAKHVLAFCRAHVGLEFHMDWLTQYVRECGWAAPDSAGRILRSLRQRGLVEYSLLSRRDSLYRVERVS